MKPISKTRSFGCSSRKREAERMAPEKAIVFLVKTISVTATFAILSGGVSGAIEKAARSMTT
jgi:hypothetical protein